MRRRAHLAGLLGLVALCGVLAVSAVSESPLAVALGGGGVAKGKIIASPRFDVPQHILAPARPSGAATVAYTITGKLVMRGCFTSVSSNGRKVKCSRAVLKECVAGRRIVVDAPYARIPMQSVSAGAGGSFSATVEFEDDYQELNLKVGAKRAQRGGLRISCFPGTLPIDISEARP